MSAAPVEPKDACTRCESASQERLCEDCARECYGPDEYFEDDNKSEGRDEELEDVLEFFKQLAIDAERCGRPVDLADITGRLERGEHRA